MVCPEAEGGFLLPDPPSRALDELFCSDGRGQVACAALFGDFYIFNTIFAVASVRGLHQLEIACVCLESRENKYVLKRHTVKIQLGSHAIVTILYLLI